MSASDSRDGVNRNTQGGQTGGRDTTRARQYGFPNDVTGGNSSGFNQNSDFNQGSGFNDSEFGQNSQFQGQNSQFQDGYPRDYDLGRRGSRDFGSQNGTMPRDYDSGRSGGRGFNDTPRSRNVRPRGSNADTPMLDGSLTTDQFFGSDNQGTSAGTQSRFSASAVPDPRARNRGGIDFGNQPRPLPERREQSSGSPYLDGIDDRNDIPGTGTTEDGPRGSDDGTTGGSGSGAEGDDGQFDDDQFDEDSSGTSGSDQSTGSPFLDALDNGNSGDSPFLDAIDNRNDVNSAGNGTRQDRRFSNDFDQFGDFNSGFGQGGAMTSRPRPVTRDSRSAGAISDRMRGDGDSSATFREGSRSRFRESSNQFGDEGFSSGTSSGQRSNRRQTNRSTSR